MILHVENHKDSLYKLLELIDEFSKVAEYKISIHTPVIFLYADMKYQKENEKVVAKK